MYVAISIAYNIAESIYNGNSVNYRLYYQKYNIFSSQYAIIFSIKLYQNRMKNKSINKNITKFFDN